VATPVRAPAVETDSGTTPKAKAKNGRSVKVEVAPKATATLQHPPPPTSTTPIKSPDLKRSKSTAHPPADAGGDTQVRRSLQFGDGADGSPSLATLGTGNDDKNDAGIVPWLQKKSAS